MKLELIEIKGFRSIKSLRINNLENLSVFAGSNGAGKSNLMDALYFMSLIFRIGAVEAVMRFGGYENIINRNLKENERISFSIKIKDSQDDFYEYSLTIGLKDDGKNVCILDEELHINSTNITIAIKNFLDKVNINVGGVLAKLEDESLNTEPTSEIKSFIKQLDGLREEFKSFGKMYIFFFSEKNAISKLDFMLKHCKEFIFKSIDETFLFDFLSNIEVFRFLPEKIKSQGLTKSSSQRLSSDGDNLIDVLENLDDEYLKDELMEMLKMMIPEMEAIQVKRREINNTKELVVKEYFTDEPYPINLISEGTVMTLAILVTILTRYNQPGITIIEEPERGINPKALLLIMDFINDYNTEHYFIFTTHSETIVRSILPKNLWFASKIKGQTEIKNVGETSVKIDIPLDEQWLTGMIGGLPW